MKARLAVSIASAILVFGMLDAGAQDLPGSEIWLPEDVVQDRFYSYLIGLVQADTCGVLYARDLEQVLGEYKGKTSIPFETIRDIRRECTHDSNPREVSISFHEELKTPVPYSILGYHPGSVTASEMLRFREWDIPSKSLRWSKGEAIELTDVYIFGVCEGWAIVDIDTWLDKILGGLLDDTRIVVLALFRYNGEWHGLAAGYDPEGEGRSGIFNFSQNKILFPTPRELRMLGPYFRNFVVRVKKVEAPLPPQEIWVPIG